MNQSRQQQQQRRKFQKFAENSSKRRSSLRPSYRIGSYRIVLRKKPSYRIDIVSSRKKAYRYWMVVSVQVFGEEEDEGEAEKEEGSGTLEIKSEPEEPAVEKSSDHITAAAALANSSSSEKKKS